ncbi:MAG: citrate lyase holo-[acyl-carrier protein] synthase [Bacillota bacterium]|nr:citrate lyase holo-[acyl-carrier protein] synthase [Bacillota bacterium]
MNMDKILKDRENRYSTVLKLSKKNKAPVLTAKINYPGDNKNTHRIEKIFITLKNMIKDEFKKEIIETKELQGYDGPSFLCSLKGEAETLKTKAVKIEEKKEVGRLFDVDIYVNGTPVSRRDLELQTRKCIICGEDTYNCRINNLHSKEEVKEEMNRRIDSYLSKDD